MLCVAGGRRNERERKNEVEGGTHQATKIRDGSTRGKPLENCPCSRTLGASGGGYLRPRPTRAPSRRSASNHGNSQRHEAHPDGRPSTASTRRSKPEVDAALRRVLGTAGFIGGPEVKEFEKELATYLGAEHVIGCANGTDALQSAMMALGLKPG